MNSITITLVLIIYAIGIIAAVAILISTSRIDKKHSQPKVKYNLTFWRKLYLIPLKIVWTSYPEEHRKSWHLVKKGLEKHQHKFTIQEPVDIEYMQCEHEGCTRVELKDEYFQSLEKQINDLKNRLKHY